MALYVVTYEHPEEAGWRDHILPHVAWLQDRLRDGTLIASGPFTDTATKSAMLIMTAPDRDALDAIVAGDPFAIEGLIDKLEVHEWDPIFGLFNARSSMPGQLQG